MAFLFLLAYLVAVLIRPHEWFVLINENATLIRDCLLGAMVFYLFARHKNLKNPQLLLLVALTFAVMASVAATGWFGGAVSYGQEFVETALIPFVLVSGLISTAGRQYLVFVIIIAASLLMVVNGHVQVTDESGLGMFGNPVVRDGPTSRISYLGQLSDPNDLGLFFAMVLPAVFLLKENVPRGFRPLLWTAVIALLYGIYLTNSRGTLLAIMALMVAMLVTVTSESAPNAPFDPAPPPGTECLYCETGPATLDEVVREQARKTGVPEEMLVGMAKIESNFDPLAVSPDGAVGVLQVMPDQAGREVYRLRGLSGAPDPVRLTDPEYNAAIAAEYVRYLTDYFGEASANPEIVVAAFNAGPTRVRKCLRTHGQSWRQCLPSETQSYLYKVDRAITDGLYSVAL